MVKIAFILLLTFSCKTSVNEGDPDPNLVCYSGVYEIDLNNDSITDLKSDIRYYDYNGKIITGYLACAYESLPTHLRRKQRAGEIK